MGLDRGQLTSAGFEVFAPLAITGREPAALFPGYVFCHVIDHWRVIDRTLGVIGLVRFGDSPARSEPFGGGEKGGRHQGHRGPFGGGEKSRPYESGALASLSWAQKR